jgi:uncharacterized protein (TIGR03067 family)
MRTTLLLLILLNGSLLAAPIPKQLKGKTSDLDRLQGLWEQVRESHNGEPIRNTKPGDFMRIEEETITTWTGNNRGFEKESFKIDSTTTPKRLSVTQKDGSEYNFCFDFDEQGVLHWAEMASVKTKYPESLAPGKNVFYSESKKVEK